MKRLIIALAALLVIAGYMAREPYSRTDSKETHSQIELAPSSNQSERDAPDTSEATDQRTPKWYASLKGPDWWLVVAAFLTLGILIYQGYQMRRATDAMLDSTRAAKASADAYIASERAWLIVEIAPICRRFGTAPSGEWHRPVQNTWVPLSEDEILDGVHLRHKIRLTNMGRTPAHIICYRLTYSCLGEGVTRLEEKAVQQQTTERAFDHPLRAGDSVEIPEAINVDEYIGPHRREIRELRYTAVFHGYVQYQHVFSADPMKAAFRYHYSEQYSRLEKAPRAESQSQIQDE
jgi:hypothetical protein